MNRPWKAGLAKEQSGTPGVSTLANDDPLDNLEDTLLLSPYLLFLLIFLEELNLPSTDTFGAEKHAPIT